MTEIQFAKPATPLFRYGENVWKRVIWENNSCQYNIGRRPESFFKLNLIFQCFSFERYPGRKVNLLSNNGFSAFQSKLILFAMYNTPAGFQFIETN